MDKQFESPDKKLGLNGSSTGDQIPSGNQNSASEDSDDESIDLDEAPIPLVMEALLQDDKILVLPHQPNMVLPPNADILPFSNDEWVVVRLLKQ